jgi:hypothetical protein
LSFINKSSEDMELYSYLKTHCGIWLVL